MDAEEVNRRMFSSVLWASVSSTGNQVASFVIFVVVARLVTPSEFGLVALAALLIELMQIISTAGLSDAVIQRRVLDDRAADTAFWANLLGGVSFALISVALSVPMARLFDVPGLDRVMQILSLTFVIAPIGAIHAARLAREFGFRALAIRNLVANLASGVVGVAVALHGGGVDALIAQRLVSAVAIAAIGFLSFRWRPRLRFDPVAFAGLARFGVRIMGSQFLVQLNVRSIELIAGFVMGPVAVATIRVANRCIDMLIQLTITQFNQVALPVLSRTQDDEALRRRTYINFSRLSAVAIFPAFAGAFVLAPTIVPAVFGPQWHDAGAVMAISCLVVIPLQFNILMTATLAATGHAGHVLKWALAQLALGVAVAAVAAQFGVLSLTAGNVLRAYLLLPLGTWMLRKQAGVTVADIWGGIARPLLAAIAMGAIAWVVRLALDGHLPPWAVLAATIAVGAVSYGVLVMIFMRSIIRDSLSMLPARFQKAVVVLRRRMGPSSASGAE